jgi:6-pyruvoyltetrahydropterin/6-carboxytetrahydropterin synthase
MYELMVESSFDAAHQLVGHKGPCENLHGHTWKVQVFISGSGLNKMGMIMDFKLIKTHLASIVSKLDHTNLNALAPFKKTNPTSENVAKYVFEQLTKKIPALKKVTIFESPVTSASYMEKI